MPKEVIIAIVAAVASVVAAYLTAKGAGASAGARQVTSLISIPPGAIMFFDLTKCPETWSARKDAEGRYIVGVSANSIGSIHQYVGTPLTNLQNRAVGAHTHQDQSFTVGGKARKKEDAIAWGGVGAAERAETKLPGASADNPVGEMNTISGTNAPYLQLLVCEKDRPSNG